MHLQIDILPKATQKSLEINLNALSNLCQDGRRLMKLVKDTKYYTILIARYVKSQKQSLTIECTAFSEKKSLKHQLRNLHCPLDIPRLFGLQNLTFKHCMIIFPTPKGSKLVTHKTYKSWNKILKTSLNP